MLTDESDWFWYEVEFLRERWDALKHPFYERWSLGRLDQEELERYANEYHYAVVAIAQASRRAADLAVDGELKRRLEEHAEQELDHIGLWETFAEATRSGRYTAGGRYQETVMCARTWAGGKSRSLAGHLVTLYAIESAQPQISETKLGGLLGHYGFHDGPATEYFRLHARLDHEHAALAREGLQQSGTSEDPFGLLRQAEATHRTYWGLLDRLEAMAHRSSPAVGRL